MIPGDFSRPAERAAPSKTFSRSLLAAAILPSLIPALWCLRQGALTASLWLDEVLYYYLESDFRLRAANLGMPGSWLAPYFGGYFFCDLQLVLQRILGSVGLSVFDHPEVWLRTLPLVCFAGSVSLLVIEDWRASQSFSRTLVAGLTFSTSPLMLYYAFEGRVFMFSVLVVIAFCALLDRALRHSSVRAALAAAAAGMVATHSEQWSACLLAAVAFTGTIGALKSEALRPRLRIVAIAVLPGLVIAVIEAAIFILQGSPAGARFPPYEPQNLFVALSQTLLGPFGHWKCAGPLFSEIDWLPSIPEAAFCLLVVMLIFSCHRRWGRKGFAGVLVAAALYLSVPLFFGLRALPMHEIDLFSLPVLVLTLTVGVGIARTRGLDRFFLVASFGGVILSVALGSLFGFLFIPRYQVPVWGAVFYAFAKMRGRLAFGFIAAVVAVELVLLPCTVSAIRGKSVGREMASLIRRASGTNAAVIVQHPVRLGYPDPLVSFPLDFYLNFLRPSGPVIPVYEMPDLREITEQKSSSRYFGTGRGLAKYYLTTPTELWKAWVAHQSVRRIWFVSPNPRSYPEEKQRKRFLDALTARFRRVGSPVSFPQDRGSIVELYRSSE